MIEDVTVDKERENFCDFYSVNLTPFNTDDKLAQDHARTQAQALFGYMGESHTSSDKDGAKNAFNSLFGN